MRVTNVNVGVLGHVDSGKTSLVRALSTQLSTAALDKHPQSQERGITLDLGFSSFRLPPSADEDSGLQVTLVDCPGHASLFKTILGGVAIVDLALLVVDVRKGLQPQTIESLVVGALAVGDRLVVALTKTDLLAGDATQRERRVAEVAHDIRDFLQRHLPSIAGDQRLRYSSIPIVPVALVPRETNTSQRSNSETSDGVAELVEALRQSLKAPNRDASGPFSLAIDHCFGIPGNGTVLTGTVLSGSLALGQEIELPDLAVVKKVKGIQVFKHPVESCRQGDRVGVRVNGLDPSAVERSVAIAPGSMARVSQVVIPVKQVPFFEGVSKSGGKFHATVGHTTAIAVATFFARLGGERATASVDSFSTADAYECVDQIAPLTSKDEGDQGQSHPAAASLFALLQFEQDVFCPPSALVVCSRLDLDPKKHRCRLAFFGHVRAIVTMDEETASIDRSASERVMLSDGLNHIGKISAAKQSCTKILPLSSLVVGRVKSREGTVDKVVETRGKEARPAQVIGRDMFAKDVDWSVYVDMVVLLESSRLLGKIVGPFGKAGKFRIDLIDPCETAVRPVAGEKLVLRFLKPLSIKPPKQRGKRAVTEKKQVPKSTAAPSTQRSRLLQKAELLYPEAYRPQRAVIDIGEDGNNCGISHGSAAQESHRMGVIERLKGETTADGRNPSAIVSGLFHNEVEARDAVGRQVVVATSPPEPEDVGEIEKPFGKAGKVRVVFLVNGGTRAQAGAVVRLE